MEHTIEITGGPRVDRGTATVQGRIEIATGNALRDERIRAMYRRVDEEVFRLLDPNGACYGPSQMA